jgi:DNA-binding GntR family transcriptional regulator
MAAAHAAGDVHAFIEADRAFHATVVDFAGNRILADLYHRLRDRQMRMGVAAMRISPDRMARALADHTGLTEALQADTPERWQRLVGEHVSTAAAQIRGLTA